MGITFQVDEGENLTMPQQYILQTLLKAFNLMLEREKVYGSAWTRYGVNDKVMHIRDITSRVEHLSTIAAEKGDPVANKLEDLLLDLINYSAMGAVQTSQGKFS